MVLGSSSGNLNVLTYSYLEVTFPCLFWPYFAVTDRLTCDYKVSCSAGSFGVFKAAGGTALFLTFHICRMCSFVIKCR